MSVINVESIPSLLAELTRSRFWGTVQIDYQNGQPILIRKTETIKMLDKMEQREHPWKRKLE